MLGIHMGGVIAGKLAGSGFVGVDMLNMANAVGNGSVLSMLGKQFQTQDTGTTPGAGVGVGVGLKGVVGSVLSQMLFAGMVAKFGQAGPNLMDVCDAIATGLEQEVILAGLTSTHTPVFAGQGVVTPGSITVSDSEWAGNVKNFGLLAAFLGDKWPDFCEVVGSECSKLVKNATGEVVITGAGTPPTSPGTGSGQGVLS